jgi:tRNA(Arg) A34 adenosine deaminase TadA
VRKAAIERRMPSGCWRRGRRSTCAGAIYWAGIGRVVFGQSERDLKAQTGAHEENPTLDLPCHVVFAAGQRPTEVVGPLLAEEAAQLQADFWSKG